MARHGTPSAPRQVDAALICVVFTGMPAPVCYPHPVTHRDLASSLELSDVAGQSSKNARSNFGLARLQQKTRRRSQEKVGSAF